ncbi:PREDICTED: protein sidekick-like [Priapulus caudatus]|uniref:Protein sidekick-like n=1 Tax=Priapulus caudatus TaxID=37621 RepID=A0ABM1E234_PRICU|nr:PREDICTED: protein sidekick-like [Priapulus caudatus]
MTKSKRSVNVSWAPGHDGNSPIESYLVQSRHVSTQGPALDWKVEEPSVPADQPWLLVGNLKAATSYQFRVAARNGVGEGRFSDPSSIITLPQEPPGLPPVGVSASASSQTAIMVQWQQPPSEEWNGVLLGYIIRYRLAGYANSVPWQQVNITNKAQRNYRLRDLIVWQDYELQMAAYNNIGIGVYSNSITERTLEGVPTEQPSRVTAVAGSSTTVNVTWKAINSQSVNGVALGYKVEAWLRDSSSAPARVISVAPSPYPDAMHEEVVDALSKYTDYTITVLCYTAVGNGPASAPVAVHTMEDVPDQVANFTFLDIHDTRVSVWWSPPVNANGILTGYKLKYQQNDNVATENVLSLEPEVHNQTVTGLVPSTEYLFSIAASTSQGLGAVTTATIKSGVPPELPGPPTGLLVSNVMARLATLSFTPGYDGKTSISLWIVQARDKSSGEWGTIHEESSPEATALSVINLRPYTNYTLRLIASNVIGESAPSDPTQLFLTMQARPATAPSDIAARTVDANSITVHWVPLADDEWNGIPRGYSIQYEATSDDGGPPRPPLHMRAPDAYANSVVLSQLRAFTEYKIAVTSYNDVGSSPSSSTVLSKSKESVPTAGAAYVSATATGAQTIFADWQDVPKAQQNGIILGYKVMYGGSDVAFTLLDVNDTRTVMLTGLRSFVNYSVQVLGYTRMGDGVLSDPVYNQTKEDVPGPPTSVFFPEVSYTTAMVNWDTPDEPNGIITNYKIQYWLEDTDSSSGYPPVELNENEHSYTAHNLQREKYYVFSITAKTRAGWGQSATVRVYTIPNRDKPGAPSKPTISASQILARSVTMSWQPGSDNYSPVRYYTVQMREGDNLAWKTHPESISPDLTFYTITDLTPYTKYSFRLQATNDKGASEWSTPSDTVVTEQDAPDEPPKQLQVLPYTETSVRITWVAPADHSWNGNKEGYLLEHRQYPSVSDFMETKVPNPQASNYTLEHLLGDREYEVRIKAYNRIGQSPPSAPETVYVGEAVPMESPQAVSAEMVNSTSIFATWLPPPEQTRNGDILGYKVTVLMLSST